MKILYVMDPIEKINVMGDSTFVLMMESQKRFKSLFCTPDDLFSVNNLSYGKIKQCLVSWVASFYDYKRRRFMFG